MQAVSYISINGRLTVIGGYKCGAINNGSVMTKNSIRNQKNSNRNNNNPDM